MRYALKYTFLIWVLPLSIASATIHVPADQPTIQAALVTDLRPLKPSFQNSKKTYNVLTESSNTNLRAIQICRQATRGRADFTSEILDAGRVQGVNTLEEVVYPT